MTELMQIITSLGSLKIIFILNIAIGSFFIINKKWRYLTLMLVGSTSDLLIVESLKKIVAEQRPVGAMVVENSYSFPSGHAYSAIVFYGLMTFLIYKKYNNKLIIITGAMLILAIAYSRLYLGVHYWWDVAAGLLLGAGTLVLIIGQLKTSSK